MTSAFRFDGAVIDMGSAVKNPRASFEIELTSCPVLRRRLPLANNLPPRRAKIRELAGHLHCSVIGTCLTTAELRRVLAKLGLVVAGDSDHDLHGQAVSLTGRHDAAAKLLNKTLDQRHRLAINQFAEAKTEEAVRGLWQAARQRGEVPGAYWALLTHPETGRELIRQAFGDVHMLSHLVGAANRADIRRLSQLEAERAELADTLQRLQMQFREAVVSREVKIRNLNLLLARKIAAEYKAAVFEPEEEAILARLVADLERRLDNETRRRSALEQRLERCLDQAGQERTLRMAAEIREQTLRHELATMEESLAADDPARGTSSASAASLDGVTLLYVGGRPKQVGHARNHFAEKFSPRQMEVLQRLWQGKQNKAIAYDLHMCERTVKVHIRHIMKKLNARNRTQVVLLTRSWSENDGAPIES
jgi:DNA-binding CsgD family transcriptional regulator